MSKVTAYYHIVFSTKHRSKTIPLANREHVYRFIWNELKILDCKLLRIGGIEDHIHLLINLNQQHSLSEVMRTIKSHSSGWMKKSELFPNFIGWSPEYFATTISYNSRQSVIDYINNQVEHHAKLSTDDEFRCLFQLAGQEYREDDLK